MCLHVLRTSINLFACPTHQYKPCPWHDGRCLLTASRLTQNPGSNLQDAASAKPRWRLSLEQGWKALIKTVRPAISSYQKCNWKKSRNARHPWAPNRQSRVLCRRLLLSTTPRRTVTAWHRLLGPTSWVTFALPAPVTAAFHGAGSGRGHDSEAGATMGLEAWAPAGPQLWLKPGANTLLLPHGKSPHHLLVTGPEGNASGFTRFQPPLCF